MPLLCLSSQLAQYIIPHLLYKGPQCPTKLTKPLLSEQVFQSCIQVSNLPPSSLVMSVTILFLSKPCSIDRSVWEGQLSSSPRLCPALPKLRWSPQPCITRSLSPHSALWAVDSSRQGSAQQVQLPSTPMSHPSDSLAGDRHPVTLSEGGNEGVH